MFGIEIGDVVNVALLFLSAAGAVLSLALLFVAVAVLALVTTRARRWFVAVDAALIPFGQSTVGGLLHDAVAELKPHVDQSTDPAVQAIRDALLSVSAAVVPMYAARFQTVLTPENVSKFLTLLVDGGAELTDGDPATDADVPGTV